MKGLFLALQFLTVFPIKKDLGLTRSTLGASMTYFPVVGALQGIVLVLVDMALGSTGLLPESVTSGILILVLALTNGGLHLDGFADTVDGLAGGKDPEGRLRIMRDSSVGAVGAVFLMLILLLKYLAIQELPPEIRRQALFLFPAIGRWAMVPMAALAPYARREGGVGEAFASNSKGVLIKSTVIIAVLLALNLGLLSLVLLIGLGAVIYGFTAFFKKRLGGVTGDVFGFQSEAAEVIFLIMALALTNILAVD
ncbi:MAG: adenosylcobinamide-GDP ribazoletransferase [Deltaproteobacteria bacterium]|nr:adenosylcobinamide-GDP ribazoletransferase [Deltaproteobacteria bacterium]